MSLKLVSLASGSKGNATLIFSEKTALLLDAGVSFSRIKDGLDAFGITPSSLDGVIITHEHSDHVRGLPKLSAICRVYAHPLTAHEIYIKQGAIKNVVDVENYEGGFKVGDISVEPFRIPHDAAYPLAYSFSCDGARCSVATDIGVPTLGVLRNVKDSDVVLLEANHDATMLREGSYPPALKARIASDRGHLSNDAAARIVTHLSGKSNVKHIILGHISENNNTEERAYGVVDAALKSVRDEAISLHIARQNQVGEVFEIK